MTKLVRATDEQIKRLGLLVESKHAHRGSSSGLPISKPLGSGFWVLVTSVEGDDDFKGNEVLINRQAAEDDPPLDHEFGYLFDTDTYNSASGNETQYLRKNLKKFPWSDGEIKEGNVYPVVFGWDEDPEEIQAYLIPGGGGGAERPFIRVLAGTGPKNYTGKLLDNPTDKNEIGDTISIIADQPDGGNVPLNTDWFADKVGDNYYIQPAVYL